MASQITVWQDNSGRLHTTKQAADRADLVLAVMAVLPSHRRVREFAEVVVDNRAAIRDALKGA